MTTVPPPSPVAQKSDEGGTHSSRPSISVIIPAYNAGKYLAEAIESALKQTVSPCEIIVVDDGSTDNTNKIVQSYGGKIRYICQANAGPAAARNTGVQAARCDWIAFLDADDIWFPDKIALQLAEIERFGVPVLICGGVSVFHDEQPHPPTCRSVAESEQLSFQQILQRNRIATSTVILPRQSALQGGGFDQRYRGPEDWQFWLRLAAAGLPILKIPLPLTAYRIATASLSQQVLRMRDQELQIIAEIGDKLTSRVRSQAMAGVHYRAAIAFTESNQRRAAWGEWLQSVRHWPGCLSEYARERAWPRVRLAKRLLRSAV